MTSHLTAIPRPILTLFPATEGVDKSSGRTSLDGPISDSFHSANLKRQRLQKGLAERPHFRRLPPRKLEKTKTPEGPGKNLGAEHTMLAIYYPVPFWRSSIQ